MKFEIDINEELQKQYNSTCAVLNVSAEVSNNTRISSCAASVNADHWTCASYSHRWMTDYAHMHRLNE